MKNYLTLIILLLFCALRADAQVTLAYNPVSCGVPTTSVTAIFPCGADTPRHAGVVLDDIYSPGIPIGFTFSFYGVPYTSLVIGANGVVSFNDSLAGTYNSWSITLGGLTASTIRNSICGPWCDMDFPEHGGSCTYQITGTAPNREFIVTYCRVAMYNLTFCPGQWVSSRIILYETTNAIEVHIMRKTVCSVWNNGRAICGVINADGSALTVAPSRDWSPNWSAADEAWRFTPVGAGDYTVAAIPYVSAYCGIAVYWYDNVTGAYLGSGSPKIISTSVTRHLKAAVFSNCRDTSFYYLTVPVPSVIYPNPKEILGPDSFCEASNALYTDSTAGGYWVLTSDMHGTAATSGINVTGLEPGRGSLQYVLPTGCSAIKFVTINPLPAPIKPLLLSVCVGGTIHCSNDSTGGSWSSGNPAVATISSGSGDLAAVSAGTAYITYSLPEGCFSVAQVTVNPLPADITPDNMVLCQGSTAIFADSIAGGAWVSTDSAVATIDPGSGLVSALTPGVAGIIYTLPGGCSKAAVISVNPTPGAISPDSATVCMGAGLVLSEVDFGGSWSSGNHAVATIDLGSGIVHPHSPGVTSISYSFTNGCFRAIPLTVNPYPASIAPATMAVCVGSTGLLTNASPGGTWASSNPSSATAGSSSGLVTGVSPDVILVTYTLPTGCSTTRFVTVNTAPAAIAPAAGVACQGDSLYLSSATPGGTWSSSNTSVAIVSPGSGIVTAISPGTSIVSYILPGVCYRTDTITIEPLPAPVTPANLVLCQGGVDTFFASPVGGVWSSGNTTIAAIDSSGLVAALSPGTAAITYSMASGCYRTAQIYVEPASPIVPSDAVICTGKSTTFTNTGTGGTWSLSNAGVVTPAIGVFTVSLTGATPGATVLTYTFPGGCYRIASVTVNTSPADITGSPKVCAHDSTLLSDTSAGGAGLWSSGAPAYGTVSSSGMVAGISGGTATISYTIPNGCAASFVVTVFALPNAGVIVGNDSVCFGDAVTQLRNLSGDTGSWYSSSTAILTIDSVSGVANGLAAGTAVVTYKTFADSNGCSSLTSYAMTVLHEAPFSIVEEIDTAKCFDDNAGSIFLNVVNGSGSYTYKWQDSSSAAVLTALPPGTYWVEVTDTKTKCTKSKSFELTQPDSLEITREVSPDICSQGIGYIRADAAGGTFPYRYQWSNDSVGAELYGLHSGNYQLTVIDTNGCSKVFTIPVRDSSGHIHIHNALSPNGDGYNDVWLIDFIEDNPFSQVQVFSRSGNVIWQRNGYTNDWDGTGSNGEKLPDGTYYYIIKLNNTDPRCHNDLYKGALLIKGAFQIFAAMRLV